MLTRKKVLLVCACVAFCAALFVAVMATKSGSVVQNSEDAISIAIPAFVEMFGDDDDDTLWKAEYDRWTDTWHVYGILLPIMNNTLGGTPEAIISAKDGQIIRIWHSK